GSSDPAQLNHAQDVESEIELRAELDQAALQNEDRRQPAWPVRGVPHERGIGVEQIEDAHRRLDAARGRKLEGLRKANIHLVQPIRELGRPARRPSAPRPVRRPTPEWRSTSRSARRAWPTVTDRPPMRVAGASARATGG